jgi:hypothetical protein
MPRVAINYQNTIIYKIVCKDISITDCYVGATTNFTKRKYTHKDACNHEEHKRHNLNVYVFIRAHGGWYNWEIIPIEKFPCVDMYQSLKQERYWIETLKATLNTYIPLRNKHEYYEKNKSEILEKNRQWKKDNLERNKETNKQYAKKNADKIRDVKKDYATNNADKRKAYNKAYLEKNGDRLNAQRREQRLNKKKQLEELIVIE